MTIEEAVNKLSREELEFLNNDPQLLSEFKAKYEAQPASQEQGIKTQGLFGTSVGENSGLLQKARIPAEAVRRGGKLMSQSFDAKTQSVPLNMALNLPGTIAEIGSNLLSSAIEPESALTAGALKAAEFSAPVLNRLGRFIGKTAESTSGLAYDTPGVLAEAVNDPSLIFAPGKASAGKLFEAAKDINKIRPELQKISQNRALVRKALDNVDNLNPNEALEARQALDNLGKEVPNAFKKRTRDIFDAIAKQEFAEADKAYARAVKSEALRSFWGINKTGSPSLVKGGLLIGMKQAALAPLLSPMAQGTLATGLGVGRRVSLPLLQNPIPAGIGINTLRRRYADNE